MAFVAIEQLAIILQSKSIAAEFCGEAGQATISFLEKQRSFENFNIFMTVF